ncbi:MAG: translation initiation factor IF-2, partial [Cyanobacteria bacterium P01_F01_bin.153]
KPARSEESKSPQDSPEAAAQLLDKPTRPAASSSSDGGDSSDDSGSFTPRLRRPSPARPGKKTRDWTDGEREMRERNSSKERLKKRRSPIAIDDDDDDFDEEISASGVPNTQVSLSIARPPKPKGMATAKPTSSAPAAKASPKRRSRPSRNRRDRNNGSAQKQERPEIISLTDGVTVAELANMCIIPDTDIIKHLFLKGTMVNINQTLDIPTATMVAEAFGILVEEEEQVSAAKKVTEMLDEADLDNLHTRPPVVTIMGHVDHGKTTLLDSIRETKVAQGEAGGITQHIGAYHVDVKHNGKNQQIVFLDTPGHEAFTAMRARGARVTDIAILVVAADDGVRPQTLEALSHAQAAKVPIVVAINKIDKEGANPERVKQELSERGLVPEEWGGETIMVPVSALKGENLDELLENLLLVSEVEDLSANPDTLAKGTVVEAHLDRARGPVATLLVQNGTLRVGDILLVGPCLGKVRAMIDDRGDRVEEASPSFAVEVLGLNEVPAAGDEFQVFADEREARSIASDRSDEQRQSRLQQAMASRRVSLTSLSDQAQEGDLKELNLILKADVQGSVEAILGSLQQLPQDEVQIRVLMAAPGEVSETDVDLAYASDAVIIGFNTTLATGARRAADEAGVDVREYSVIYKLLDDIQGAMEGLLEPELVEEPLGEVAVRAVFPVRRGSVAGCYVLSGKVTRNCRLRVRRGGEVVYEGTLDSLKRMKDDVKEVASGFECGIGIDKFNDWKEGDVIEAFRMVTQRRSLTPA